MTSQSTPQSIAPERRAASADGRRGASSSQSPPAPLWSGGFPKPEGPGADPSSARPLTPGAWPPSSDGRLPLLRGGRPLKRWRYVGVFCAEWMACAARVQLGPAQQSFWALYLRGEDTLYGRTRLLPRRHELRLEPGRLRLRDRGLALDLRLEEDAGFQALCPHGRGWVWTRKQAGIAARGTLELAGTDAAVRTAGGAGGANGADRANGAGGAGGAGGVRESRAVDARAVIDDTAGYHARETEWWWTAGVGRDPEGRALAWNLVSGVNDPPEGSERAVWIDGVAREAGSVRFAADLSEIVAANGERLRFTAEAQRRRSENLLVVRSDYTAPFGTFAGTLPGGVELAHGLGVVEHHRARW